MHNYNNLYEFDFTKRIYPQNKFKKAINKIWIFIPILYVGHFLYLEHYLLNNKAHFNVKEEIKIPQAILEREYGIGKD